MLTVLLRTVIIYLLLMLAMRLMGKRQIGELEISDLVTTILISEIASIPITDNSIPLTHAVIPIVTLLFFEIAISLLLYRRPRLKLLLSPRPSTLIKNGRICQRGMADSRISFDELLSALRRQGVDDISSIKYAILEQNGSISVIQKADFRQPNAKQLHLKAKETGLFHIVVEQGSVNRHGLDSLALSRSDVCSILQKRGMSLSQVYLMLINDGGEVQIIEKEGR